MRRIIIGVDGEAAECAGPEHGPHPGGEDRLERSGCSGTFILEA